MFRALTTALALLAAFLAMTTNNALADPPLPDNDNSITAEQVSELLTTPTITREVLEDFLDQHRQWPSYWVTLRCNFAEAKKAGNYTRTHKSAFFSGKVPTPTGCVDGAQEEVFLFQGSWPGPVDSLLSQMERQGLMPAPWPAHIALGADHPELQTQFPIVGLDYRWTGDRDVQLVSIDRLARGMNHSGVLALTGTPAVSPLLQHYNGGRPGGERVLDLDYRGHITYYHDVGYTWGPETRFAAVRLDPTCFADEE